MSLRTSHNNTSDDWYMTVNGNGSSIYSYKLMYGTGSSVSNVPGANSTGVYAGFVDSTANTSNTFANIEIYFPNYANTSYGKSWGIDGVTEQNGTLAQAFLNACYANTTSAIS